MFIAIHLKTSYKLLSVYSVDLFTTSLSWSISRTLFLDLYAFMLLNFFSFGIKDDISLLCNKLFQILLGCNLEKLYVSWVLLLLCHIFSLHLETYTKFYWLGPEEFQERWSYLILDTSILFFQNIFSSSKVIIWFWIHLILYSCLFW